VPPEQEQTSDVHLTTGAPASAAAP
jgi:hypothetical protein